MSNPRPYGSDALRLLESGGQLAAKSAGVAARTYLRATAWSYRGVARGLNESARILEQLGAEPDDRDEANEPGDGSSRNEAPDRETAASSIVALHEQAFASSAEAGAQRLFRSLLETMVPDEAIVFAAVASGEGIAAARVERRVPGGDGAVVLENATLVADKCAISSPKLASAYVARLRSLDLIEIGPEDPELATDYEVLIARADVREAQAGLRTRTTKGALRPTELGRELWDACRPADP